MVRWLSDEEQAAWRGLLQMSAHLDSRVNRDMQDTTGLSRADYGVLVPLSEAPDGRLRVFEIAHALGWEQSRLSHHLARMDKRGLVERVGCTSDRRGAFVLLTEPGRQAIEKAAPAHVELVRRLVFDVLSPDEVAGLTALTAKVLERLHADEAEPECPEVRLP